MKLNYTTSLHCILGKADVHSASTQRREHTGIAEIPVITGPGLVITG